jgi:hypothetical protein
MTKPSSFRALFVALLLVASMILQTFPVVRTGVVLAKAPTLDSRPGDSAAFTDATKDATTADSLPQPQPAPTVPPSSPLSPVITATLTDNIAAATKVASGGQINYTATVTNSGVNSPADDALNVVYNHTVDTGNYHGMVCAFVTSAEYQARFATVTTHINGECSGP